MKIRNLVIALSIFSFLSVDAFAQADEANSGSPYSYYGIGSPTQTNTAQEKGMGIIGVSFNDLQSPGLGNPAFWGIGAFTRGSANFGLTNYSITDGQDSGANSLLNVGSFQAVFPVISNKLGLSVALFPETRSNYSANAESSRTLEDGSLLDFGYTKEGTGGLTKFEVGLGYRINKNLSIGYAPSYSFLTQNNKESVTTLNNKSLTDLTTSSVNAKINGTNLSHRFGVLATARKVFGARDIIQVGAAYTLKNEFEAKKKRETVKTLGDTFGSEIQIGATEQETISLPSRLSGGISYFAGPSFSLSVEGMFEDWSNAEYGFDATQEASFSDRFMIGVGTQFNAYNSNSRGFLSNFEYTAGVSYDSGYLNIEGQDIETLWFSAGLGMISPIVRSQSSFDFSVQYGIRGTTDNNLVKENIWAFNLSVNLAELMFFKRKLN